MALYNHDAVRAGTELAATMTGSTIIIGTLPVIPILIIFDNQGTVPVSIYVNGAAAPWRTFPAGEALTLDVVFPKGTTFSGNGASGTFSISYLYEQNLM